MRIVCIIQARMGSTRLPGKTMMDIAGRPMVSHVVSKAKRLNVDKVVVAVADEVPGLSNKSPIVKWCVENKIEFFVGPTDDVLLRYLQAAHHYNAEAIVRITADCPLLDPCTSNKVIKVFADSYGDYEYVSNIYPERTFPQGWDTEIFTYGSLLLANNHKEEDERNRKEMKEHVTPWIKANCKMWCVKAFKDYSKFDFSVDTKEDLDRVRNILE